MGLTDSTNSKRSKNNQVPEYEDFFGELSSNNKKPRKGGVVRRVVKHDFWRILLIVILYTIKASPLWVLPVVTSDVIDVTTTRPEGYVNRLIIDGIIFFVFLAQNVPMHYWEAHVQDNMLRSTIANLRKSAVRKLQRLSITYHREIEGGKIQSKFLRDIDGIDTYFRTIVQVLLPNIIGLLVSVGISLWKSPIVTLFFVAIVPLNVLNVWLFRKKFQSAYRQFRFENEGMSSAFTTMLQMMTLTKSHGLENVESVRLQKQIDKVTDSGLKVDRFNAFFGSLSWVISQLLAGACLFFCVFLCLKDKLTIGEVVLFQSLFASINGAVLSLVNCYPQLMAGREAVNSVSELMTADDMEYAGGTTYLPAIQGKVDFDHVFYRYPDGQEDVIKDFDLHVKPGECIALVGSSGSGKSTIMNLLIGLLSPTEGEIKIDDVPMKDISMERYRHFLSVVPQNSILFDGTMRENITYGLDNVSEEELNQAVHDAAVDEFLPEFPKGLDTKVGEGGDKLSGGQKQRICIARALIRQPRILILDEATSALDNVSEYHIQQAINRLVSSRTTFVVAHRLSTIRNANRILVMENGAVVEEGNYDDLMQKNGKFAELVRLSQISQKGLENGDFSVSLSTDSAKGE